MKIKIFSIAKVMSGDRAAHELENKVNSFLESYSELPCEIKPISDNNGHIQQIMLVFENK